MLGFLKKVSGLSHSTGITVLKLKSWDWAASYIADLCRYGEKRREALVRKQPFVPAVVFGDAVGDVSGKAPDHPDGQQVCDGSSGVSDQTNPLRVNPLAAPKEGQTDGNLIGSNRHQRAAGSEQGPCRTVLVPVGRACSLIVDQKRDA